MGCNAQLAPLTKAYIVAYISIFVTTYNPSKLGQTDLAVACDQSSSVDVCRITKSDKQKSEKNIYKVREREVSQVGGISRQRLKRFVKRVLNSMHFFLAKYPYTCM